MVQAVEIKSLPEHPFQTVCVESSLNKSFEAVGIDVSNDDPSETVRPEPQSGEMSCQTDGVRNALPLLPGDIQRHDGLRVRNAERIHVPSLGPKDVAPIIEAVNAHRLGGSEGDHTST